MASEQSDTEIDREVVEEALGLIEKHADSRLWFDADDEMAADHALAAQLLRGELEGEHARAARHSSEVLPNVG